MVVMTSMLLCGYGCCFWLPFHGHLLLVDSLYAPVAASDAVCRHSWTFQAILYTRHPSYTLYSHPPNKSTLQHSFYKQTSSPQAAPPRYPKNPHQCPGEGGDTVTSGPYIVALPDSPLNRAMYVELTRFHAAMYFSMHAVTHVDSELESEDPGFGTHFSKQVDLRFCIPLRQSFTPQSYLGWLEARAVPETLGSGGEGEGVADRAYVHELLGVGHGRLRPYLLDDGVLDRVGVHGVGGGRFRC